MRTIGVSPALLDEVLSQPQSQDVGFVFLKGGLLREPNLMQSCINRLENWRLRHVILYACQDGLERAQANTNDWASFSSLMEAVGNMKTLIHLQVKQQEENTAIPVEWMACLLENAGHRLERLELSNARFQGSLDAYGRFVESIKTLTSLKSCAFDGVALLDSDLSPYCNKLDPSDAVVGALVQLPKLVDVVLDSPILANMRLQSSSVLSESNCFQQIESLKLALPANALGTMKVLSVAVLRSHQLRSLEIQMIKQDIEEETIQTLMMELAVAIGSNTNIQTFKLVGDPLSSSVIDPFLVQLALELSRNPGSRLRTLYVTSGASSCRPCVGTALMDMLQFNYTLEDVKVFCHYQVNEGQIQTLDATKRTEIDFFLSLNRGGRKRLLQEDKTRRQWWDTLSEQNPDALYYYLRANPWLCQPMDATEECNEDSTVTAESLMRANQRKLCENRALELENQILREELEMIKSQKSKKKRGFRRLRKLWRKSK